MTILAVGVIFYFLYSNLMTNLRDQNIATGFDFLQDEAAFEIGEKFINYTAEDSFGRAILVGLINSLFVSVTGIFFALILGVFIGIFSLSKNLALKRVALFYIELIRNLPLLLQLFFWYALMTEGLPNVENALSVFRHIFISNRGLNIPYFIKGNASFIMMIPIMLALLLTLLLRLWSKKRQEKTGKQFPILRFSILSVISFPLIAWIAMGRPPILEYPIFASFNFNGGLSISPELFALLFGLIIYTAAFMAEIVRSGILAIDQGQWEAAKSLGLSNAKTLRLIILPQTFRIIIPPMISQMLNLTKNSSLAVAIGYPDIVSVANTTMNQTGQAIEAILFIMLFYLSFSLITSFAMNWYNRSIQLKGGAI